MKITFNDVAKEGGMMIPCLFLSIEIGATALFHLGKFNDFVYRYLNPDSR
ncbi:MAG: hypothetical protein Q9O24_10615 [Gammaproteobacteria bacterium]|nr:hypothetical protein [Gammaproteobacteria bacterium]